MYNEESYHDAMMEDNGWVRASDLPDLDSARDWLKGAIEALYETGKVDDLESCLEEVCAELDVPFPKEGFCKVRERSDLTDSLEYTLGWQRGLLDSKKLGGNNDR